MAKMEKRNAEQAEAAREETNVEHEEDTTRSTKPRSKKAKRKSGF
jgi:hypothetical protein